MDKQILTLSVSFTIIVMLLIAFIATTIDRDNLKEQLTQTKEAHMACQEIAKGYITSTSSVLPAISTPSLYTRQQAQIAIQVAQDIAVTHTDTCLKQ